MIGSAGDEDKASNTHTQHCVSITRPVIVFCALNHHKRMLSTVFPRHGGRFAISLGRTSWLESGQGLLASAFQPIKYPEASARFFGDNASSVFVLTRQSFHLIRCANDPFCVMYTDGLKLSDTLYVVTPCPWSIATLQTLLNSSPYRVHHSLLE